MNRRLPIAITFGLVIVLLGLFAQAIWGVQFIKKKREQDLEDWIGAIGITFAQALDANSLSLLALTYEEQATFGLLEPETIASTEAAWPEGLALTPAEAAEASFILGDALKRLAESNGLRSAALLTEGALTLGSTDATMTPGLRWPPYENDRTEIVEALEDETPTATPLYPYEDEWQKRSYVALPPGYTADLLAISGLEPSTDAPEIAPRVLLRLEASADYLAEVTRFRRASSLVAIIGSGIVLLVSVVFYLLIRRLQLTTERLAREDRFRSLGKLVAGLAHEMRNPLGILRFSVDELEYAGGNGSPEDARSIAEDMRGEIDRMNRMIADMLSFSQESEMNAKGECELGPTLTSCGKWLEKSAPQSWELELPQMSIESTGDDWSCARLAIDGDALRQILLNLLRNAAEALEKQNDPTPRVKLAVVIEGKHCRIVVADNGPGIPSKTARRIFEPFFTAKEEGTGLGLALSRRLAESVGGALAYEPGAPRGSKFILTLPVAP